ncbi:hypothetical protein FACS1894172_19500 [Spirochaetia bacterium]|nr:hypothetical protein FACS1894172_19500 [Spirochaetia bacterium]
MKKNTNLAFVGLITLALISTLFLGCPDDGGDKKSDAKALTTVAGKTVAWGSETGAAAATAKTGSVVIANGTTVNAASFVVSAKAKADIFQTNGTTAADTAYYGFADDATATFVVKVTAEDDSVLWYKVAITKAPQATLDVAAAVSGKSFVVDGAGTIDGKIFYDSGSSTLYTGSATGIDLSGSGAANIKAYIVGIFGALTTLDEITFDAQAVVESITFKASGKTATQIDSAFTYTDDLTLGADATVGANVEIVTGKKLTIATGVAVTIANSAEIIAGDLIIATDGSLTATGSVTIDENGIKGASAKLALDDSIITLGNDSTGAADVFAAALDSVDVYLATGTASVVVTSSNLADSVATLTLKNGAKISGLTDNNTSDTVPLSGGIKWPGTGGLVATGLSATSTVSGGSTAAATEFIAQTTAGTPGTFAVTTQANDTALDITIVIATVASAAGV